MGRKVKWTQEALNQLRAEYNTNYKVSVLAAHYKVSRIRIYQLLKKAGVTIRGPNKTTLERQGREEVEAQLDRDYAEHTGQI